MNRPICLPLKEWRRIVIILILFMNMIPIVMVKTQVSNDLSQDEIAVNRLQGTGKGIVDVSRLMTPPTVSPDLDLVESSNTPLTNHPQPNYAIGSQNGTGGGNYDIYDSFNWTGQEVMNTSNTYVSGKPTNNADLLTITNSTGFNRQYGIFNITNVEAEYNKTAIEDSIESISGSYTSKPGSGSDGKSEIAMSFTIGVEYAHIKSVRTYVTYGNNPTGLIYISESGSDSKPNDTRVISSKESLAKTGENFYEYTFQTPVLVNNSHTFFVIMNETNDDDNTDYWRWWYVDDDTNGDNDDEGIVYYRDDAHAGATWWGLPNDLPLEIELIPVESNGTHYNPIKYTDPTDLDFIYESSEGSTVLTTFANFHWNESIWHNFSTNTAVSFNLSFVANYTYASNPINGIAFYSTQNNTDTFWNVTFSTRDVNNTYNVKNRTISISGLQSDWNGWEIYWNDSSSPKYSDLDGDPAINYSNGSSTMVINMSTTWQNQTWNVSFNALNYLYSFNISLHPVGTPLELPYQTYTMNDYNFSFVVQEAGNLTYWIDYPNESQLLQLNIDEINTNINDTWDINSTFDNVADVNGTYQIQAFWNNSDLTKVGTYTRTVNMIVNTTNDFVCESQTITSTSQVTEVLLDTNVNISVFYNSTHNTTVVSKANITGVPSWGTKKPYQFNHSSRYSNYTFSLEVNDTLLDPGDPENITIYSELEGYVSNITVIYIRVVGDAFLEINISQDYSLEWRENETIQIKYNKTLDNTAISGATVAVDGDSISTTEVSGVYYFKFNTTKYSGEGTYQDLAIVASSSAYITKTWYFNLTITPGLTHVNGSLSGQLHLNKTILEQRYADSDKDDFTLNLVYFQNLTSDILDSSAPSIVSAVPYVLSPQETNLSWTITFGPDQTGVFAIDITFDLANYTPTTYIFNLSVLEAHTKLGTDFLNNTEVYYGEYYNFTLFYNNTDWNENITTLGLSQISISDEDKVQYNGKSGDLYNFSFNYNPQFVDIASHSISITFDWDNYEASTILLIFTVVKSPFVDLSAINTTDLTELVNETSNYIVHYSPDDYDSISVLFNYFENQTSQIFDLNDDGSNISVSCNPSIYYNLYEELYHNWTLTLNGSTLGNYLIQVRFNHENYTSKTFEFYYTIQPANSKIINYDPDLIGTPINESVKSGNTFEFWVVWQSEYNEYINDTDGVEGNGTETDIVLFDTNPATGNHTFKFTAPDIGIYMYNLTFHTINYTKTEFFVCFNVTERYMTVSLTLSTHDNNSIINSVQYNETYYFSIVFNDTETGAPVTANFASLPENNISFVSKLSGNHTFYYNASVVGNFSALEIVFYLDNYENYSYVISFNVDKRRFEIDNAWSIPTNGSTIQVKYGNTYNFSVFMRDRRTLNPLNVSGYNIGLAENISFITITVSGNHSFNYTAGHLGLVSDHTIEFSLPNYHNLTYYISFNVYSRFMMINGTLSKPDSGQNIDTLQYDELFYFNVFLMDNETFEPVNASIKSMDTGIIFIQIESTGNHSFYYNASSIGDFYNLQIVFNLTKYSDLTYTISFEVAPREMSLDTDLSTEQTVDDLQYGDIFYFYVFLNDSRTQEPLNISSYSSLPTHIFFENFTLDKGHLFRYEALELVVGELYFIDFSLLYYNDLSPTYQIIISVFEAESQLITPTSPITTYYTIDTDFSVVWENIPNLPTSPTIRISTADLSIQTTSGWSNNIIFQSVNNGNYSLLIVANQTGSFTLTLVFGSPVFVNKSVQLSIVILPAPTYLGAASPANGTTIGISSPFYFSEVQTIQITWLNGLNDSGIEDPNPVGSSELEVGFIDSLPDGTHSFIVHGSRLKESNTVIIILEIPNYQRLVYILYVRVSIMPTLPLDVTSFNYSQSILVEDNFEIMGNESFLTFQEAFVPNTFTFNITMKGNSTDYNVTEYNLVRDENWFLISFSTEGYQYGEYNLTLEVSLTGYQVQKISLNVTLHGREVDLTVTLPSKTFEQGESIEITAILNYTQTTDGGSGAGIMLVPLSGVEVSFFIGLEYSNGTSCNLPVYTTETDVRGEATYTIDRQYTQDAIGFSKIEVESGPSSSGLPSSYSMSAAELAEYKIIYIFDPLEIIIPVIIIGVVVLLVVGAVAASGITLNRKRKRRSAAIHEKRRKVEQSFEDIKSIRLLIARHESGLQFYSEKTIAELQTDTDALSGMSAALSTFMEEVSDGMRSRTDEEKEKEKIEVMSREGLHMLIWHGTHSSFIIISEARLPDYFKERLANLGREVESKFAHDLEDFYRSDQIPSNQIKKMIRKHIPLHYFSAFVLNEGVLTLESIKLSKKEKKMLELIKEIRFQKEGIQFFFSEQIISHLSKHYNRSEAIKFLDRSIEINLLIEASQEDILSISK